MEFLNLKLSKEYFRSIVTTATASKRIANAKSLSTPGHNIVGPSGNSEILKYRLYTKIRRGHMKRWVALGVRVAKQLPRTSDMLYTVGDP